jgi:DNA repair protein RadA/Sms
MAKTRTVMACRECRQQTSQWVGRCPGCGAWGTVEEVTRASSGAVASTPMPLRRGDEASRDVRVATHLGDLDRVLGGGLVPGSVTLLAGEPGIGKSTLMLQLLASVAAEGHPCLLVSGEESHAQVAGRTLRLGIDGDRISFAPGRDLAAVLSTATDERPFLLAVDSIQALRDTSGTQVPGGVAQVRTCADALVGLAKTFDIAVVMTGHVTKDGDLAGPRALEHAVDVVLSFDGDARSGLRVVSGGKNRFGAEGESAWFEMGVNGLLPIDPTTILVSGQQVPGAAVGVPLAGRRALAVEVQALVGSTEGPARRQATGLDARRFQLVAAVLDRSTGIRLGRAELFGASSGGIKVDDPACDLAVAAALASASSGVCAPEGAAFVGEVSLTGQVRSVVGMRQRFAAARAAGCTHVFAPPTDEPSEGLRVVPIHSVGEAVRWARVEEAPARV